MPTLRRTIRLFVSSTFLDMKAEREVLQGDVFPKLRQLCFSNDLGFQPIDLRWGVPAEAGKDNRTMRICLRELKRCQEARPKPNFLILLGDRYGWRPLPEIIPAHVFAKLRDRLPAAMQELFEWRDTQPAQAKGWYRRDDNAVPPVYELRPRGDDETWHQTVEQPLLHALEAAARELGLDADTHGVAIGTSATEQEIIEGALKVGDAQEHVHAFSRTITGLPRDPWPKEFVDVSNGGAGDSAAAARLDRLKSQIVAKIGTTNVHPYTVPWREGVQAPDLIQFGGHVFAALKAVVLRQIRELTSTSRETQEEEAHRAFGDDRRRGFIGRTKPLRQIASCLRGRRGRMLVVVGSSGSGKSAVISEAVRRARESYGEDAVLARFIGATPDSVNILSLLRNLVTEIRLRYPAPPPEQGEPSKDGEIPVDINPLTAAFHESLTRATAERPLFVFLDALDQLAPGNGALEGHWLPGALNVHVQLILSAALPAATNAMLGEGAAGAAERALSSKDPRSVVMAALERHAPQVQQIRLQPLSAADGRTLVAQWLAEARRTLQRAQKKSILKSFVPEGNPLWLRAAITESQRLASWDSVPDLHAALPRLMRQVLGRLSAKEEHGAVLVEQALASIASARHGLAEDEVMDVLSANKEVMKDFYHRSPTERRKPEALRIKTLPVAVWVRLHGDVAPYLAERQLQNATLLSFYHRSFLEAVQAAFLSTAVRKRAAHQRLSDYFRARTWFIAPVDEEGHVQREAVIADAPDVRKASELPWQMLRVANALDPARANPVEWDPPVAVLCDMEFVEAKCRAGLVFELQEDYREARIALPETQPILREEQRRTNRIARWTDELIRYAQSWSERRDRTARGEHVDQAEPVLPIPPPTGRMWSDKEIEAECKRIKEAPTRLDRLTAFARFVQAECYPLLHFGGRQGFALQHGTNYTAGGPVHDAARRLLPQCHALLLLQRRPEKAAWNPRPTVLQTFEGRSVRCVSVTPDGRRAISGVGKSVCVWDLESGACLQTLEGHVGWIASVNVTTDGRLGLSGSEDGTLRFWDLESGTCLRTLEGHSQLVHSVSATPDGCLAVSGSLDKTLRVWDLNSGACLRTLEGHEFPVTSVSVTPDGRSAVSVSGDRTLRVWDLESGQCERILRGHNNAIETVSVTPDGRQAVSGDFDNTLLVWDLKSAVCVGTLKGHSGVVWSVSITPDGRRAVSGSGDRTLRVWDLKSGQCERSFAGHSNYVTSVSVTPDGRFAVSASQDDTVRIWDLHTSARQLPLEEHRWSVESVSVTSDRRLAVSGSRDGTLRVWDLESGVCSHVLEGHSSWVTSVIVSPDGKRVVSGQSGGDTLRVWDLQSGACLRILGGHKWSIRTVSVTPDGQRVVSGGEDSTIRIWDLESGICLRTLKGHSGTVWSVSVTPDGQRVVSGGEDSTIRIWDLENGICMRTLKGDSPIRNVSVSPDGRRVVSEGGWVHKKRVWDLESGACLLTLQGDTDWVAKVSVSPDGRLLLSREGLDDTVRIWDIESGVCLRTLKGHSSLIKSVSITADGRHVLSGSGDKTLRVWDLQGGACLGVLAATESILVTSLSGGLVIIGTEGGKVLFIETRNLQRGPEIAPDTSEAAHEASLRRGLNYSRRENGPYHEQTLAHLAALVVHLRRVGKTGEADCLREERELKNQELNSAADRAYQMGDYHCAERLLRSLIIADGLEVSRLHCNLARVLLMQDRMEARTMIEAAWQYRSEAPSYILPRILWLQLALVYTWRAGAVGMDDAQTILGRLKTALAREDAHMEWDMSPVLTHLQSRLPAERHELLTALVAGLNCAENLLALEQFPAWREAEPQLLE